MLVSKSFQQQNGYIFLLSFENGKTQQTDLTELIAHHVSIDDLKTARINPEWKCLEFKDGMVDIEPKTLYQYAMKNKNSPFIRKITPNPNNYSIQITYSDDVVVNATFSDILDKGVMTVLIGKRGRSIIWKEYDIDFCADSLRFKFEDTENQLTNYSMQNETQAA